MSKQENPHPDDEFDVLGADRTPQGVHRSPVPRWRQWLPFILVVILAPTLAFVAVKALSNDPEPTATTTVTSTADAGATTEPATEEPTDATPDGATSEGSTSEQPSEEPSTTAAAALDHSVSVYVLNGAGRTGLAGTVAETLGGDGWTNVIPDNYSRQLPTATTLFYTNADFEDEAQAIGEELGITTLVESADASSNGVVIVLRSDFQS